MITIIDLSSSEDETPVQKTTTNTTQEQRNQKRPDQHCQSSTPTFKKIKRDTSLMEKNEYDFIDHVVMTWLDRVRIGYKNIEMPDSILKSKGKEAAFFLKWDHKFSSNIWLKGFKEKVEKRKHYSKQPVVRESKIFRIEAIIQEERHKLKPFEDAQTQRLKDIEKKQKEQLSKMLEEQKKHLEKVKEAQRQHMEQIKEAKNQRDDNLRKQGKIQISEVQKVEKTVPHPASATKLGFGVLRKPDQLKINEARASVSSKPLSASGSVAVLDNLKAVPPPSNKQQIELIQDAQKQQDNILRKQEEMKIKLAELRKAEQKSKTVSLPTSATKSLFGVVQKPESLNITEVKGVVPSTFLSNDDSVTVYEVIEVDDVLDEPIESYDEALDCLSLVENYFLSTRNLNAVMFVNQIECFLKEQQKS